MPMLEGAVDGVIGVDTHTHTLTAAADDPVGAVQDQPTDRAELAGYQRLLTFGRTRVPGRRGVGAGGTGSDGAGLAVFLATTSPCRRGVPEASSQACHVPSVGCPANGSSAADTRRAAVAEALVKMRT
jgi:hypothetical protein